jgi:hypothetical protein
MAGRVKGLAALAMVGAFCAFSPGAIAGPNDAPRLDELQFMVNEDPSGNWRLRLDVHGRNLDHVTIVSKSSEPERIRVHSRDDVWNKPFRVEDGKFLKGVDEALQERGEASLQVIGDPDTRRTNRDYSLDLSRCDRHPRLRDVVLCKPR